MVCYSEYHGIFIHVVYSCINYWNYNKKGKFSYMLLLSSVHVKLKTEFETNSYEKFILEKWKWMWILWVSLLLNWGLEFLVFYWKPFTRWFIYFMSRPSLCCRCSAYCQLLPLWCNCCTRLASCYSFCCPIGGANIVIAVIVALLLYLLCNVMDAYIYMS